MRVKLESHETTPTVFIVDDDTAVRCALSLLMESCGWKARGCATGGEFFAALAFEWPACLVVDPQLPDMDGAMLQREISRLRMNLPVIVMTSYDNHPYMLRAALDGAKAVIAKPFQGDELVKAISRAMGPNGGIPRVPPWRRPATPARLTPQYT